MTLTHVDFLHDAVPRSSTASDQQSSRVSPIPCTTAYERQFGPLGVEGPNPSRRATFGFAATRPGLAEVIEATEASRVTSLVVVEVLLRDPAFEAISRLHADPVPRHPIGRSGLFAGDSVAIPKAGAPVLRGVRGERRYREHDPRSVGQAGRDVGIDDRCRQMLRT